MIVRVATGTDPKELLRCVLDALRDPDVDSVVIHRPGSEALLANGEVHFVDAGGHWTPREALAQADGCGR